MGRSFFVSEVPGECTVLLCGLCGVVHTRKRNKAVSHSPPPLDPPTPLIVPTLDPSQDPVNTTDTEGRPTPAATTPATAAFFENYTLAQNSLQQTAQSLDVAFERLRELRRTLLTYQQAMTTHTNQGPTAEPSIDLGPSHSALVLTDSTSDDYVSLAPPDPPLYIAATPLQWSEMSPFRFMGRHPVAVYDRENGSLSPSDDNTTPIPPTHTRHRPLSDDSSTTLARRLAARQYPAARHRSQILGSVIDILRTSRTMEGPAPLVDLGPDLEATSRSSRVANVAGQRRETCKDTQFVMPTDDV